MYKFPNFMGDIFSTFDQKDINKVVSRNQIKLIQSLRQKNIVSDMAYLLWKVKKWWVNF